MRRAFVLLAWLALLVSPQGCGTIYKTAVDERSVGSQARDVEIEATVFKRFVDDPLVKAADISTFSYYGEVYLVGEYESQEQINRAVRIAKGVPGVRAVTTYLLPKRANDTCGMTDNLGLMAEVKKRLIKDTDIWSTNVEVKVVQCHIVLLGLVGSPREVAKAEAHAKAVPGSRGVASFLKPVR
jgi:hyperosmotically inducible protein